MVYNKNHGPTMIAKDEDITAEAWAEPVWKEPHRNLVRLRPETNANISVQLGVDARVEALYCMGRLRQRFIMTMRFLDYLTKPKEDISEEERAARERRFELARRRSTIEEVVRNARLGPCRTPVLYPPDYEGSREEDSE